jgi:hypothetical protein
MAPAKRSSRELPVAWGFQIGNSDRHGPSAVRARIEHHDHVGGFTPALEKERVFKTGRSRTFSASA